MTKNRFLNPNNIQVSYNSILYLSFIYNKVIHLYHWWRNMYDQTAVLKVESRSQQYISHLAVRYAYAI